LAKTKAKADFNQPFPGTISSLIRYLYGIAIELGHIDAGHLVP
jgi:hypothetical protein